jgi:hypothetical protein
LKSNFVLCELIWDFGRKEKRKSYRGGGGEIMTIYSKDKYNNKRCRRYNKRKQRILYALGRGFQGQNRRKRNKKLGREGKENSVIRWNMQRGRD